MTPEERRAEWERIPSQDEIDAAIEHARCPALLLNKTTFPDDPGEPGCWLGGEPTLPPEFDWPYHKVNGISSPLHFIAQINLERVPRREEFPNVPKNGTLFFFFDPVFWTNDAKVIYFDGDASRFPPSKMPDLPYDEDIWENDELIEIAKKGLLKQWKFDWLPTMIFTTPPYQNSAIHQEIAKAQLGSRRFAISATAERREGSVPGSCAYMSFHYMFGCEQERDAPQGDNQLLLAILDDDDVGIAGGVYYLFWAPREAIEARDFNQAFLTKE